MSSAVAITRTELTAAELRQAAGRSRDATAARRMLALALVPETCGMDRQTLRDWVHRYNADGLAGLANRSRAAAPRRLSGSSPSSRRGWRPGRTPRSTGWYAGGGRTCAPGSRRGSGWKSPSGRWASTWRRSVLRAETASFRMKPQRQAAAGNQRFGRGAGDAAADADQEADAAGAEPLGRGGEDREGEHASTRGGSSAPRPEQRNVAGQGLYLFTCRIEHGRRGGQSGL